MIGAGRGSVRYDVVIAGAGPAGAATAALLARAGATVALVDRSRFPRPKACAEYFSPGVVDVLRRLGTWPQLAGLPHACLRGMELVAPHGARHLLAYPDDTQQRRSLTMRRDVLDAMLLDGARRDGATVLLGRSVRHVLKERERAVGLLVQEGAALTELRGRLVIGADGARSVVAQELGLTAAARWPARVGLIAHHAEVRDHSHGDRRTGESWDHGEMHVAAGVYCGIAPLGHGAVNVGMVTSRARLRRLGSAEAAFSWMLKRLPAVANVLQGSRREGQLRGAAPLAHRCRRPYAAGALLVGDAAGFLDPFTGEGVFRALRGAEIAATVAQAALERDDVSAHQLAPYSAARREAFAAKDRLCLLIQAFVACPRLLDYAIPRLNRRCGAQELAAALGDYRPASRVLNPLTLGRLLGP
jgi:geranylgeranyl reductase family protein